MRLAACKDAIDTLEEAGAAVEEGGLGGRRGGSGAARSGAAPDRLRRQVERTRIVRRGRLPLQQLAERLQVVRLPADREQVAGDRQAEGPLHVADREAGEEILEVRHELGHAVGLARRWVGGGGRNRYRAEKSRRGERGKRADRHRWLPSIVTTPHRREPRMRAERSQHRILDYGSVRMPRTTPSWVIGSGYRPTRPKPSARPRGAVPRAAGI